MHHSVNAGSYLAVFSSDIEGRVSDQPAKGGRAMTVGRKPYLGPAAPCAPPPMPASGIPPSRLPGPPAASAAALMLLTGMACPSVETAGAFQDTGTESLPPREAAPPSAATGWAAAAPP